MPNDAKRGQARTAEFAPSQLPPHTHNLTEHQMDLISLVVTLIVVGVLLWLVNNYIPMDGQIKRLLNAVVVISTVIWLLNAFGVLNSIRGVHVGK
jgi:hypothetical protein